MAYLSIYRYICPLTIFFVTFSIIMLSILSWRWLILDPLDPSSPQYRLEDLISNITRSLAILEARADRLQAEMRRLSATAREFEAREDRRRKEEDRGRFERRELCDNAWWWWRLVHTTPVEHVNTRVEEQTDAIPSATSPSIYDYK